jgi:hypothetical protein
MAEPFVAPMPPYLDLPSGFTLRINAVDPASGNQVTGVRLTEVTVMIENLGGGSVEQMGSGPFMLVPGPGA